MCSLLLLLLNEIWTKWFPNSTCTKQNWGSTMRISGWKTRVHLTGKLQATHKEEGIHRRTLFRVVERRHSNFLWPNSTAIVRLHNWSNELCLKLIGLIAEHYRYKCNLLNLICSLTLPEGLGMDRRAVRSGLSGAVWGTGATFGIERLLTWQKINDQLKQCRIRKLHWFNCFLHVVVLELDCYVPNPFAPKLI